MSRETPGGCSCTHPRQLGLSWKWGNPQPPHPYFHCNKQEEHSGEFCTSQTPSRDILAVFSFSTLALPGLHQTPQPYITHYPWSSPRFRLSAPEITGNYWQRAKGDEFSDR